MTAAATAAAAKGMRAVESQMSNGSMSTDDDTWGIVGIIGGSPVLGPAKTVDGQRATASDILATSKTSRNRYRSAGFDRRSSSPPSSLHRRLERSRISGSSSSHSHAGHSSDCEQTAEDPIKHVMHTPKAQTGKRHAVQAMQGPSSATSKRLQKRAVRQNVVYTYGRSRENDDFDEVFGHQLGASRGLGAGSQQLLSYGDISDDTASKGATSDSEPRPTSRALTKPLKSAVSCSGHLLDLVDLPGSNGGNRSSSSEEFKKWFGDVTQGLFAIVNGSSPEAVCLQILDGLDKPSFFEELVNNKHWLPALLQSLHRARDSAVVLSTTMVVIASAFAVPTVMQVLVFERQVLETVADILKQTANVDVLLLRHRRDFDSSEQLQCVSRICKLVRQRELLGASVVVSTYNLAMCALHSFTRSDDVAFIAMAGLLRSEMRESGCLGLVAERVFLRSVPHFICKKEQTKAAGGCIEFDDICAAYAGARAGRKLRFGQAAVDSDSSDPEAGDMWMDFDLPEETKTVAQAAAIALLKQRKKGREATLSTAATRDSSIDPKRILRGEPEGSVPTFASIAVELELLRFCTSASADNQNEMLDIDTCVPSLLGLLTACQQAASSLNGVQLIRALETAALTLQLLVNLSNSSTMFSSRFVAERGLHVVSRSIALVSQRMQQDASSSSGSASSSDFSPRRQALLQDAGDLRYDILLITSALLTNLVESDASATLYFNHVLQSPRCALGSRCIPECICSDRTSLTTLLSQAFMACHGAGSSPDAAVAAGYIAVLLGFIMRNKTPSREAVLKRLPRRDTSIVITHIQQFIQVSDSVNQRFGGLIGGLAMAAQTHQTTAGIAGTIRETDSGRNAGNMLAVSSVSRSTAGGLVAKPASKIATSLQTIIDTLSAL
ncbi:hypothetical protein LPJ53_001007 [Coemansia erecta]|uniref:Wings apart-like protein C-terminal domain-containing protein n=1 Tax=Coemansia erecta TaxID=147472 RepID=A0A9W7Y0T4_9FUNG|nr:hypothetical protein LPJ53_001007 [Coemansia erecta]